MRTARAPVPRRRAGSGSCISTAEKIEAPKRFRQHRSIAPLDKLESAMNAGQDFIGGDLCDHYAFRQGPLDWQIWITTGSRPLPRKIVVTNRGDDARPQSVSLIEWNLKPTFKDAVFKFAPPKGAKKVETVPVKSN